jgi:hypothetical protein
MLNNPAEKAITLDQSVQTFDQLDKGFIPGFGAAQIDTFPQEDNVDASHPLNVDYFIAGNFQRLLGARLSFRLRAFRSPVTISAPATGGFVTSSASSLNGVVTTGIAPAFAQAVTGLNTGTHTHSGVGSNITPPGIFVDTPAPIKSSFVQFPAGVASLGSAVLYPPPTASAVTSVGVTYGVFESTVATGVTVAVDGTDVTALLTPAGPYNADQLEIDLRPIMTAARISTGAFHTIQLTPTGLGRIHAFLRLTYFVNGQIA